MRRLLRVFLLAALAACGSRESATRIATSDVPLWSGNEAWTVSLHPTLEIGRWSEQPDAAVFHDVRGLVRLADGRIAVAEASDQEIRIYSPAGEHHHPGSCSERL